MLVGAQPEFRADASVGHEVPLSGNELSQGTHEGMRSKSRAELFG